MRNDEMFALQRCRLGQASGAGHFAIFTPAYLASDLNLETNDKVP